VILLDTHAVVWLRADPDRLGPGARAAVEAADELAISDITLWELAMLVSRGRLELVDPLPAYLRAVSRSSVVLPITADVATTAAQLPESFPTRDPADRIIYATARANELPLLSAGGRLRTYDPAIIWT
jgi:PIN domain nuclease of toxin-antitoxin system